MILVGTFLLMTPAAAAGAPLGFVDALFTATSATCVTGLVVVDTGTALSPFGQAVVLVLIQVGGLGIMTYSSIFLLALGRRLSFRGEALLEDTIGRRERTSVGQLVRDVVLFTLAIEAVAALLLAGAFARTLPAAEALYHGLFHSVSAFCNAGFSLYSASLTEHRGSWWVNGTVIGLVTLGGLGFVVLEDLKGAWADWRAGRAVRLRLHSKVVLAGTLVLTVAGTAGIWLFERGNALTGLPPGEALLACLFQAVTPRTAGFNTLDYAGLTHTTLLLTLLLMFVGANPGSCGGGIKVTTAALVAALFRDRLLGRRRISLFRRTVPDPTVARAVTILLASFLFATAAVFGLLALEVGPVPHTAAGGAFLDYFFEVVSAFGTVGLSTGVTPSLSPPGRLLLTAVMFAGRLGPLTLAMAVGMREERDRVSYAQENLMVG
ncbi:MAG: potassium transporter TrkG [Deferrisomatales bacterium]|nr:potassium transporter TrkG [Deferrisomatales bacterium]